MLPRQDDRAASELSVDPGLGAERPHVLLLDHSLHGPAQARSAVAACVDRLGLAADADDLLLVVSELVTNAVRHGAPPVRLEVSVDDDAVLVCVADGSSRPPQPRTADEDAEGGRGMTLVDLLSRDHGVRPSPPGKAVWASLARHPSPAPPHRGTP